MKTIRHYRIPESIETMDAPRRMARTVREAFREWPENCIGIAGPVPTRPSWFVRIWRRVLEMLR